MQSDPFAGVRWIWMNGALREFEKATVHVLSHGLHYGSAMFEGIRCYETPAGPAVFRLPEHLRRLEDSCKIYRMGIPYSREELAQAVLGTIAANGLASCYIRPIVYRGFGSVGVSPLGAPVEVAVAAWPWGAYLGAEALEQGVDVRVSSWRRANPDSAPATAKAAGNYLTSQLVKMEAGLDGYAEGIALDAQGLVSEGSAENLFLVRDGEILTPPVASAILPGITRDAVAVLARDLGLPLREAQIPRGMLYTADELFFSGTAVEVTPIRSVDRIPVGDGRPGPVTRRLMRELLGIARGEIADRHGWLTPVPKPAAGPA